MVPFILERYTMSINNVFQKEYQFQQLNKRTLGKVMIIMCGNEGSQDDNKHSTLRQMLQAAISYIEKEKERVWDNAEIKIYDGLGDIYLIKSGTAANKFVVMYKSAKDIRVIRTHKDRNECCVM